MQVAQAWKENAGIHRRALKLLDQGHVVKCEVELVLPVSLPELPQVTVYLDHKSHFILDIGKDAAMENADDSMDVTSTLLSAAYAHRRIDIRQGDFAIQLASRKFTLPSKCSSTRLDADSLGDGRPRGLVRDVYGSPYLFGSVLPSKPPVDSVQRIYKGFEEDSEDKQYVAVSKYPRGPGLFLQPLPPPQEPSTKPYSRVLPTGALSMDDVPTEYTELGLLMPSLIHYIEIYLIASKLSETLLAPLNLENISMVVTAISASSARLPTNYERVEFLGDSILKLCVTVNVASTSKFNHPRVNQPTASHRVDYPTLYHHTLHGPILYYPTINYHTAGCTTVHHFFPIHFS